MHGIVHIQQQCRAIRPDVDIARRVSIPERHGPDHGPLHAVRVRRILIAVQLNGAKADQVRDIGHELEWLVHEHAHRRHEGRQRRHDIARA